MGRGSPWEVVLSQTYTVAWECLNDSHYSQTHLSSCQGPIESVKLHQQVLHRKCDTQGDSHTHTHTHTFKEMLCVCLYQYVSGGLCTTYHMLSNHA